MSFNFFAGPAILPKEVIEKSSQAALSYGDTGLSILEVSHRSKPIVEVMDNAEALIRELLEVPDEYAVLFLTGGASSQFFMTAMNLLDDNDVAGYLDTGTWSTKAIKEANNFARIEVVASSSDSNFNYIPKSYEINPQHKYLHLTSNNTIFGTQIHQWPDSPIPFVCDMSSDIFSRPLDISKFDLIYAGAQKNLGPAGVTLVIIKKEILGRVSRKIPTMLNYQTHIDKKSSFNTPPVFPIFVSMLTLEWIKKLGGVSKMQERNEQKAGMLYAEIDRNSLFKGTTAVEDRSLMNVCFVMNDESLQDGFASEATANGLFGLKGHRSVGGFRASIYNAMPLEGVEALVGLMKEYERKHG